MTGSIASSSSDEHLVARRRPYHIEEARKLADLRSRSYKDIVSDTIHPPDGSEDITTERILPRNVTWREDYKMFQAWAEKTSLTRCKTAGKDTYYCTTSEHDFRNVEPANQALIVRALERMGAGIWHMNNEQIAHELNMHERYYIESTSDPREVKMKIFNMRPFLEGLEELIKPMESFSIKTMYLRCRTTYETVLHNFDETSQLIHNESLPEAAVRRYNDLNDWAEDTGATLEGEASLDFKLSTEPELKDEVLDLYHRIDSELKYMIMILEKEDTLGDEPPDLISDSESDPEPDYDPDVVLPTDFSSWTKVERTFHWVSQAHAGLRVLAEAQNWSAGPSAS
ncbi:hypothetical protein J4E93_004915 [Alternaria ventricosa]|uniref:uncharacterized protein n=1 Tax=Alternaria ventricosa TaxID=1187951 RepID=UPI0020C22A2F|nr:uncharacterized protein J4E93_004915 [Alternaria ventricosa]KAI4646692.1 hypothetical protein J4E93_004915 [Alternaria ventricosa]